MSTHLLDFINKKIQILVLKKMILTMKNQKK